MRDLYDSTGTHRGMRLEFFGDASLDTLVCTRPTEIFNLTWKGSLPDEVTDQPFSVRYTAMLRAREAGEHILVLNADQGVRLWFGGRLLVDRWENGKAAEFRAPVRLTAGEMYPLRLEYRQPTPNATSLRLEWITPTRRRQHLAPDSAWTTYLPAGTAWYDFWTGERLPAGNAVTRKAPIDRIPLFVRAGSILPLGPALQYTDEKPADPMELRVYPGADGSFTLYEDEGDSYRYENGAHATILFRWDDRKRALSIGTRQGAFAGMLTERTFKVVLVRPANGVGLEQALDARTVRYTGRNTLVRF